MKTKQIRSVLCKALIRAEKGALPVDEAKNIIGITNQICKSLDTEVNVARLKMKMGDAADAIGELDVSSVSRKAVAKTASQS